MIGGSWWEEAAEPPCIHWGTKGNRCADFPERACCCAEAATLPGHAFARQGLSLGSRVFCKWGS